jgi:hypothetical protein
MEKWSAAEQVGGPRRSKVGVQPHEQGKPEEHTTPRESCTSERNTMKNACTKFQNSPFLDDDAQLPTRALHLIFLLGTPTLPHRTVAPHTSTPMHY